MNHEKNRKALLALVAILSIKSLYGQDKKYAANWESLDSRPIAGWFEEAKFGIFIHWRPYSVPSWSPKGTYQEWYLRWFTSGSIFGNGKFTGQEIPNFDPSHFSETDYDAFAFKMTGVK